MKTEQEKFWAGDFGDEYIRRNYRIRIPNYIYLFSKIISRTSNVNSIIEFGSNIGNNLIAINYLLPNAKVAAVEINRNAVEVLKELKFVKKIYHQSIFDFVSEEQFDLVFTKGLLIHINPEKLNEVYEKLYITSKNYILVIEAYNPTPVEVDYRGHRGKLFKRDFAGEIMDIYPDLALLDYGFTYRRDPNFPLDDSNYFLLRKNKR